VIVRREGGDIFIRRGVKVNGGGKKFGKVWERMRV
jgi:hypothetical protein